MDYFEKQQFSNEIDERMCEAMNENRRKQMQKDRERRKKRKKRRIAAGTIAVFFVCGLIFGAIKLLSSDVYSNEEEFTTFASSAIAENGFCYPDDYQISYDYSEPISTALRQDFGINATIREFRNKKLDLIRRKAVKKIKKSADNGVTHAVLMDTAAFDTGNGALSLYIQCVVYSESDKSMILEDADIYTYMFNKKTMKAVDNLQVLNVNYKDKASEYAVEYFKKTYNDENLIKYYEDYTKPLDNNFNKFIMTGKDIIFLFDQHTVLSEDNGIAFVKIPYTLISSAIRPKVLDRYIDASKPMVAITYDDGPGGKSEKRILKYLSENGSVATFFYLGNRMDNFKENALRAVEIGCEIGNHSWEHPILSQLSKKQIVKEIKKTNEKIHEICGVEPVVARPPYGDYNKKVLKASNMAEVLWTVDTLDWQNRNPKKIMKIIKNSKSLDGKIILMHSIYDETADATKKLLPWLNKHGYQTVTVSELIKYKTGKTPKAGKVYIKVK